MQKACKFCGKLFTPRSNRQVYCDGPHYQVCPVCGKQKLITNNELLKYPPSACSYACRVKRTQATSLQRYGCKAPGNNPEARQKAQQTCIENHGVPYAMQSEKVRELSKQTLLERYGVDNAGKNKEVIAKRMQTCKERYGQRLPFNRLESYTKQHQTILARYGVPYFCMTDKCAAKHVISKINRQFAERLNNQGIETEFKFRLDTRSYDLKLKDSNVLIEIDPTYTHNIIGNHWCDGIDRYYHRDKSQLAEENGYRCIHVFDWDDLEKVVQLLTRPTRRVFARKCTTYRLNKNVGDEFLQDYHIQGTCRGQLLYLGLVHEGELLQVMTFGRSRFDKNYDVELLRLCTKPGVIVVGGASKLFSYATNEYGLSKIISYCDRAKFNGDVYTRIGMKLKRVTPPQEIWSKESNHITANLLRSRGYDQLFGTNYGKGTSNETLMLQDGWLPIFDCGQKVFVYD